MDWGKCFFLFCSYLSYGKVNYKRENFWVTDNNKKINFVVGKNCKNCFIYVKRGRSQYLGTVKILISIKAIQLDQANVFNWWLEDRKKPITRSFFKNLFNCIFTVEYAKSCQERFSKVGYTYSLTVQSPSFYRLYWVYWKF
jgi:hypothetical protein